jgi:hypothetical protein
MIAWLLDWIDGGDLSPARMSLHGLDGSGVVLSYKQRNRSQPSDSICAVQGGKDPGEGRGVGPSLGRPSHTSPPAAD